MISLGLTGDNGDQTWRWEMFLEMRMDTMASFGDMMGVEDRPSSIKWL